LRFRRIAVTSQVGQDQSKRLGKLLRNPMPNGVRLGMAMKQQQRPARAAFARHDFDAVHFNPM
jgi:hypothetical protein